MKKYALLLSMVLALSTSAWGGSFVCVQVSPDDPSCDTDITLCASGCVPGDCSVMDVQVCVKGSIILMDIHMDCTYDCAPPYSTTFNECVNIGKLCPGAYAVLAMVHCSDVGDCAPCCGGGVRAMGTAYFDVCCENPCWPWYRPCQP